MLVPPSLATLDLGSLCLGHDVMYVVFLRHDQPLFHRALAPRSSASCWGQRRGAIKASTEDKSDVKVRLTEGPLDDVVPRFRRSDDDDSGKGSEGSTFVDGRRKAKTRTLDQRLRRVMDEKLGEIEKEKEKFTPVEQTPEEIAAQRREELSAINPAQAFGSACFAGFVSYLFWRITVGLSVALNGVQIDPELYPVRRLFAVASTAFVGLTALGAGVIGLSAVGMFLLSGRVAIGIATGELDPSKKPVPPAPPKEESFPINSVPDFARGAWYDVKLPKQDETKGDKKS